jgi:hypothetical protein
MVAGALWRFAVTLQASALSHEQRRQYEQRRQHYQNIPLNARQLEKLQENQPRREEARNEHLPKREKEHLNAK